MQRMNKMKKIIIVLALLILLLLSVPLIAINNINSNSSAVQATQSANVSTPTEATDNTESVTEETASPPTVIQSEKAEEKSADNKQNTFKLYDTSVKKIIEVPDREFCCGALATEMDSSENKEALKAQTVALYSYYSAIRKERRENPTTNLNGADFACNCKIWQVYVPQEEIKEKWGNTFDDSYSKIKKAVDEVFGTALIYNGTAAKAYFHKMSWGITENSKDIINKEIPYITSVASPFDMTSNNYITKSVLSEDEFVKTAKEKFKGFKYDKKPKTLIKNKKTTKAGSVKEIEIGNIKVSGTQVQQAFSLRSSNFDIIYSEDKFVITVIGYGSGLGMSQNGCIAMAEQGSNYKEILNHYYPNTELTNNYIPEI